MKLTNEIVKLYEGGQLEIQNSTEGYLFRGEVETAQVLDNTLAIKFKWLAKMGDDGKWHAVDQLDYAIDLELTSASEIGEDRIHYEVMVLWEHGTFFPPDGSKLDPSKVVGLRVA